MPRVDGEKGGKESWQLGWADRAISRGEMSAGPIPGGNTEIMLQKVRGLELYSIGFLEFHRSEMQDSWNATSHPSDSTLTPNPHSAGKVGAPRWSAPGCMQSPRYGWAGLGPGFQSEAVCSPALLPLPVQPVPVPAHSQHSRCSWMMGRVEASGA